MFEMLKNFMSPNKKEIIKDHEDVEAVEIKPQDSYIERLVSGKEIKKEQLSDKDPSKYPCMECGSLTNCLDPCGRLSKDHETLMKRISKEKCCPDCGTDIAPPVGSNETLIKLECEVCKHKFYFNKEKFKEASK